MLSHAATVVERYTPVSATRVIYRATVSDPIAYTRPWTIEVPLNKEPDELLEVACHEDNGDLQHLKDVRDEFRAQQQEGNSEMTAARLAATLALVALRGRGRRASFVLGGIRPGQAREAHRQGHRLKFSNPHAWIYIDVAGTNGKVENWALEMSGANALIRRGWRKEDLPAGTLLVVEGWQARNSSSTANIATVTFEDGRTLFAGTSNPAAPKQP